MTSWRRPSPKKKKKKKRPGADLHHECAGLRELEQLIVGQRFEPGQVSQRAVVAANPDVALVVHVNAIFSVARLFG